MLQSALMSSTFNQHTNDDIIFQTLGKDMMKYRKQAITQADTKDYNISGRTNNGALFIDWMDTHENSVLNASGKYLRFQYVDHIFITGSIVYAVQNEDNPDYTLYFTYDDCIYNIKTSMQTHNNIQIFDIDWTMINDSRRSPSPGMHLVKPKEFASSQPRHELVIEFNHKINFTNNINANSRVKVYLGNKIKFTMFEDCDNNNNPLSLMPLFKIPKESTVEYRKYNIFPIDSYSDKYITFRYDDRYPMIPIIYGEINLE